MAYDYAAYNLSWKRRHSAVLALANSSSSDDEAIAPEDEAIAPEAIAPKDNTPSDSGSESNARKISDHESDFDSDLAFESSDDSDFELPLEEQLPEE